MMSIGWFCLGCLFGLVFGYAEGEIATTRCFLNLPEGDSYE